MMGGDWRGGRADPRYYTVISEKYVTEGAVEDFETVGLDKVLGKIEAIIKSLKEERKEEATENRLYGIEGAVVPTVPNLLVIEGLPGSGKSTIILNYVMRQAYLLEQYLKFGRGKPDIIPLDIIYPALMPAGDHPLGWVYDRFHELLEKIFIQYARMELEDLYEKLRDLRAAAMLALAENFRTPISYLAGTLEELVDNIFSVSYSGALLVDKYVKFASSMRRQLGLGDSLILIAFDDIDTRTDLLYEILLACRLLSVDTRTLCLLGVSKDMDLKAVLKTEYARLVTANIDSRLGVRVLSDDDIHKLNRLTDQLAENLLDKTLRTAIHIEIPELGIEESLEFKPLIMTSRGAETYKDSLGSILKQITIPGTAYSLNMLDIICPFYPNTPECRYKDCEDLTYTSLLPSTMRELTKLTLNLAEARREEGNKQLKLALKAFSRAKSITNPPRTEVLAHMILDNSKVTVYIVPSRFATARERGNILGILEKDLNVLSKPPEGPLKGGRLEQLCNISTHCKTVDLFKIRYDGKALSLSIISPIGLVDILVYYVLKRTLYNYVRENIPIFISNKQDAYLIGVLIPIYTMISLTIATMFFDQTWRGEIQKRLCGYPDLWSNIKVSVSSFVSSSSINKQEDAKRDEISDLRRSLLDLLNVGEERFCSELADYFKKLVKIWRYSLRQKSTNDFIRGLYKGIEIVENIIKDCR